MAILSGAEIRRRISENDLAERLVLTPILEPSEQLRDDQASVDIRLGFEFALFSPSGYSSIDEFADSSMFAGANGFGGLYKKRYVPFGKSVVIHPHQFMLAATLEYLRLPKGLAAYVNGRSTWGRLGLIIATAVGVQPGFAGTLTLELRNLGETPLNLYPGQVIAQLFFHTVEAVEDGTPGIGQYSGDVNILPRRISSEITKTKLSKLIARANGRSSS